jgi:hypothetical protein
VALPFDCVLPKARSRTTLLLIQSPVAVGSVVPHLQANALYYSQQIWLNADSHLIVMLLAPFRFKGKSVIDYIDPVPVTVLGNMLGFVWDDEADAEFAAWKKEHADFAKVDFDLVSVPTGGVFAEAVLGRSNSAEKLDLTRFWNWQDSPIPDPAAGDRRHTGRTTPTRRLATGWPPGPAYRQHCQSTHATRPVHGCRHAQCAGQWLALPAT